VLEGDRSQVEQLAEQTQQGFAQLLKALEPYPKARAYIENLVRPVSTFLTWWLKKKEVLPLTTNAIESHFSQVCNRVKRIDRRWSDRGLLNWLTVSFYKIFKPELWSYRETSHALVKTGRCRLRPPTNGSGYHVNSNKVKT
jgi:hypothetical protein